MQRGQESLQEGGSMSERLSTILDKVVEDLEVVLAMESVPEEAKAEIRARYRSILMHRRGLRSTDDEEAVRDY